MSYSFYPPQVMESWPTRDRFMARWVSQRGVGVLIDSEGTVSLTRAITQDEEKEYAHVFFGGHTYTLHDDDAAALISYGFPVVASSEVDALLQGAHDGFLVVN